MSNKDILTQEEKPICNHVLNTIPNISIERKECPYKNTCKEAQTWKKIAEKLAEELTKLTEENKEYYLDWARKEVEKDDD